MARTRRIKVEGEAYYHVTSRITGKQFLLKSPKVKALMLAALEQSAKFSGVDIGGFCIMDDHFHILLHIPDFNAGTLPDEKLLERIEILSGKKRADALRKRWTTAAGDTPHIVEEKNCWRRRMYDLSQFVKTFKEEFRRAFQREHEYSGRLWGDRFHSTVVESAEYLSRCAAYVEMNPVRAGMATETKDYAWNTTGAAARGNAFAKVCREWMLSLGGDTPQEEGWMMRRWPQMTKGKLLGSSEFVTESIIKYQQKLVSHRLCAKRFAEEMCASHGYRIKVA